MIDWNDEELMNIVWGEATESDDHIVPYPDSSEVYCKKKERVQESGTIKSIEQKAPGLESDIHIRKLDGSSSFDPGEGTSSSGFQMDSWPYLSLSNAAKTEHDTLDNSVPENLTEISKFDSSGEAVQLGQESGIFQNPNGVKDQGDFVDCSWDGSFDDLDQIFSNDDPIFGNVSLGNPDELWPSSKDKSNSPVKSFACSPSLGLGALSDTSEPFRIEPEFLEEDDEAFTLGYGKDHDPVPHSLDSSNALSDHLHFAGGERSPAEDQKDKIIVGKDTPATAENFAVQKTLADKVHKQNKPLKGRKKYEEKSELKLYQDLYGNWSSSGHSSSPHRNQFPLQDVGSSPSAVVSQERQLHGTKPLSYQYISNSFVPTSSYGNMANPYAAMPVLSHIQPRENQSMLSGYEVSLGKAKPVNNTACSPLKLQNMTPQEKIEKLRRRQQMQAMLAIQRQQQQFGHDISSSDPSIRQCSQENQVHQVDGGNQDVEDLSTLPTFDPSSPSVQDDSSATSLAVNNYSAEDTILHRLQDVVSKLDVRVRHCIRDSLFRLAESATQRHFVGDTNSTNNSSRDDHVVLKEEKSGRNIKIPEVETESNPIDRTVAHLLFHRPMELSGKHPDKPESPASAKLQSEHKMIGMRKFSMVSSPRNLNDGQGFSLEGSRSSWLLSDP